MWLRRSVVGLSPRRLVFHPTSVDVRFVVDKLALGLVFLPALLFILSVSFHHCSILIHPSTTHAVYCFSPSTSVFPVSIIPPMLHTHPSIYHPLCIMFFSQYFSFPCQYHSNIIPHSFIHLSPKLIMFSSQYFSFPCQYHSTIAPYSSIHLSHKLIMFFSQYFSFPLSVSFHHCSRLIIYIYIYTCRYYCS